MKKSDLVPGTKVIVSFNDEEYSDHEMIMYYPYSDDYNIATGVVLDKPAPAGKVFVKWGENDQDLDDEEEVDIKLLTLDSDRSKIEQEFKDVTKQVKEKMKAAADLIHEAHKLAKKGHAKSLESMYDATAPLIGAMDSSGWRSSSWGC